MASYGQAVPPQGHGHRPAHAPPVSTVAAPGAPVGTFASGTKIQVGSHRVVIQKYLSEGGFAHVYLVRLPTPVDGTDQAVLKRVAVPDKEALRGMRTEVETMKRLKGHTPIVTYIDSHASELRGGGYEVFLLMEYCNGGGLIDFMNTRLQHRLTEPEILAIFSDVAEGVACMHYLKPPLLHRDLKVENVLITVAGGSGTKKFKLCDFGSAAPPRPAPTTVAECRLADEDVQKHTTMQYRSPEMIDVYRKQPIDEKSDIWALGVLLYKLCYYTTPFEDQGQLAILNASYKFPSYPAFSDKLKRLIASMLREDQKSRPNIFQVVRDACAMRGLEAPIKDIYSGRSRSEPRSHDKPLPPPDKTSSVVGAVFSPSAPQQQVIPEVERMRRGRPPAASLPQQPVKPSRSPPRVTNGDPFAALDSKVTGAGDELSSKFPTLDQFSLLHDSGSKFNFDNQQQAPPAGPRQSRDLSHKVSQRLADEAFSPPPPTKPSPAPRNRNPSLDPPKARPYPSTAPEASLTTGPAKPASSAPKPTEMSRAAAIISNSPELQAISSQAAETAYQQQQQPAPRSNMVSTGTMTATPPPERPASTQYQIYRFPPAAADQHRSTSVPRQPDAASVPPELVVRSDTPTASRPGAVPRPIVFQSGHARQPSSSRPSLEGGRPPDVDLLEPLSKSRSATASRPRPASAHLESNIDYLRERESTPKPLISPAPAEKQLPSPGAEDEPTNITSNVAFLRSMEDADPKKRDKSYHKHGKRSSLTSLGTGTKNILSGKFGDAFKRFEGGGSSSGQAPPRTPSPLRDLERRDLTPIAGSEATDGRSDDGEVLIEDEDDMTPEMRRELERRRLSEEEQRVAAAAAEYRQRVQSSNHSSGATPLPKSIGGVSRAVSIQNKVQSLLEESSRSGSVARTAQGYGHYSDTTPQPADDRAGAIINSNSSRPAVPRKPTGGGGSGFPADAGGIRRGGSGVVETSSSATRPVPAGGAPKPVAPPKPTHLVNSQTAGGRAGSPPKQPSGPVGSRSSIDVPRVRGSTTAGGEQLVAVDLPGQPAMDMSAAERDDYIRDFQKRFPSLTSIEMVERDLDAEADAARLRR